MSFSKRSSGLPTSRKGGPPKNDFPLYEARQYAQKARRAEGHLLKDCNKRRGRGTSMSGDRIQPKGESPRELLYDGNERENLCTKVFSF